MALGDDERTSYFAAAGGPTGLTAGIAELEAMRQSLSAPKSNVIIPETGAAKYWYVDPRASGVPGMPVTHTGLEQQSLYRSAPNMYSPPHEDQAAPISLINRTPRPIPTLPELDDPRIGLLPQNYPNTL